MTKRITIRTTTNDYVPGGTRVLNVNDAEPGIINNGFAFDPELGGWYEYEVETAYGIERWHRRDFVLMNELETK